MACKACGSEKVVLQEGEITASWSHPEDLKAPPIYFSQQLWVCLDCGLAELRVPPPQMDSLRTKKALPS